MELGIFIVYEDPGFLGIRYTVREDSCQPCIAQPKKHIKMMVACHPYSAVMPCGKIRHLEPLEKLAQVSGGMAAFIKDRYGVADALCIYSVV